MLKNILSSFVSQGFWGTGGYTITQDRPTRPRRIITKANVVDGEFNYTTVNEDSKYNNILVKWLDPKDGYAEKSEQYQDNADVFAKWIKSITIPAYGCTSRGQAQRVARYAFYSNRHQTEIVSFATGLDQAWGCSR